MKLSKRLKRILNPHQQQKYAAGLCVHNGCTKAHAPGRTTCYKCRTDKFRERNYLMYTFNALRNNARRRCREFTLTLEEFRIFCAKTDYLEKKGRNAYSATIDRINNSLGYSFNNIQILDHEDNCAKGCSEYEPEEILEEPF